MMQTTEDATAIIEAVRAFMQAGAHVAPSNPTTDNAAERASFASALCRLALRCVCLMMPTGHRTIPATHGYGDISSSACAHRLRRLICRPLKLGFL